ncbi:MAG: choice-of-anchor tandem repeat GloVer-containing protein [Terriglobales bacterium]
MDSRRQFCNLPFCSRQGALAATLAPAIVFALAIFLTQTAQAQTLTTLYAFSLTSDGAYPYAGLVQGTDGNFYGTTSDGGDYYRCNQPPYICGMVFKITPAGTLTILADFTNGATPRAGLVQGTDGNFYGTTSQGGSDICNPQGCGTVFKITPAGELTTLYDFSITDGAHPYAGLVQGTDGNFYGTTVNGTTSDNCPPYGCGTVFKITPSGTLTTLYSFCPQDGCPDGYNPLGGLVQATDGNFYGTTDDGGDLT